MQGTEVCLSPYYVFTIPVAPEGLLTGSSAPIPNGLGKKNNAVAGLRPQSFRG